MTQSTQQEALTAFRMLRDVNASRLRGQSISRYGAPIPCGTLDEQAATILRANLSRRPGSPLAGDAIVYVVSCDGTPIAWLGRDATVTTPPARLTDYQVRQQGRTVEALTELSRHAVQSLAALADQAAGRAAGGSGTPDADAGPHVLVADPARPTLTHWSRISTDPAASAAHLRQVCGTTDRVLVVAAAGYGGYGTHAPVIDLEVVCAFEQLAYTAGLPASVVGDWLHAEGGSTGRAVPVDRLTPEFQASYAGVYAGQQAFAAAEADRRGWTAAFQAAGIPLDDGRIAVFYRHATRRDPAS